LIKIPYKILRVIFE